MYKVFLDDAWKDYIYIQVANKKLSKKINEILKSIDRYGYKCIGKPEPLIGKEYKNCWSARIDKQNRLVFRIEGNDIIIFQCLTHYGDK